MGNIRKGIKMRVEPEQSKKVQEICFENDISWITGKEIDNLNEPFLFIDEYISYVYKDQEEFFIKDKNEEVSAELFIKTNGTCVESEAPTKDNNKGEKMEELKLECLVEGYEGTGTYFEVGQVWETRDKTLKAKIIEIDINFTSPILVEYCDELKGKTEQFKLRVNKYGRSHTLAYSRYDLVKLKPKTLSEYLKENNAYESFVENLLKPF